jgi:guanine deaminase
MAVIHQVTSRPSEKRVFIGRVIHSKSLTELEVLETAALGVSEDGIITFVDTEVTSKDEVSRKYPDFVNASYIVLRKLQFLFPGLIDSHLHACQWPDKAMGMDADLKVWIEKYTDPIEASYSDNDKARSVYSALVQKELDLGTTTCAYNSTIHHEATNILASMCQKYGQRAIIGKSSCTMNSTSGNWEESVEQSIEDDKRSIKFIQSLDPTGHLILPCVQPRGGPFCPPDLMAGLGRSSRVNPDDPIRVQAHMCETLFDTKRTRETHPGLDTYAEMYEHYGLMHRRSIMAHCIHLTDTDIKILAKTGAGVAHNPNSNTCLTDGECNVRALLRAGIKVGLGTDCSAGYSTSMLDAMRQASNVSRHLAMHMDDMKLKLDLEEIVWLATVGSAQVLGLDDKVGNFAQGKCFDALMVDVGGDDCINITGWEEDSMALFQKWVFMGDDRSIRLVYVNGVLVSGKDTQKASY